MIYGYARVSSKCQLDGNSLEAQEAALREKGCTEIVTEQYTGTSTDRPKFTALVGKLKAGDTLVVTKLDRFARNVAEGSKLIKELLNRGVSVNVINMGLMENTEVGRLLANVLFSIAEFERDMIISRTQEGKAVARTKEGFKEGRPEVYNKTRKAHAIELLEQGKTYREVEALTGMSRSTLARAMREHKAKTMK